MSISLSVDTRADAIPIHVLDPKTLTDFAAKQTDTVQTWITENDFAARAGEIVKLPASDGGLAAILLGSDGQSSPIFGGLPSRLPAGHYVLKSWPESWSPEHAALAWALGDYRFDTYQKEPSERHILHIPETMRSVQHIACAVGRGRDLINMPAGDMGPEALHEVCVALAEEYKAKHRAIIGDDLLTEKFPLIHAVGRAAHQAPRLVELRWGSKSDPHLALIGKGITFDTGGLNLKSAGSMRLMKKDMGGAATALALAEMIMSAKLPLRLSVYLAIAENAVSANAYRPGDILIGRNGLSVEIDNTDAEGRLVMADALSAAAETEPDLIIDFATLTGAARTALGPDLPPFFTHNDALAAELMSAGSAVHDPVWRMPLWQPYRKMLDSFVADCRNAGGRMAGAITAALFLEQFVARRQWVHFDVYGWSPHSVPGRPKGGEIYAARAVLHYLQDRLEAGLSIIGTG